MIRDNKLSLSFERPLIMGILNVTPDSFSDGGKYNSVENAFNHAQRMLNQGADIIDIGGESTRPGAKSISIEEECSRTISVIQRIIQQIPDCIISIDTNKSAVAQKAVAAGAKIVNDVSGGLFDEKMIPTVAELDVPYIIMHTTGKPDVMQQKTDYKNVIEEIYEHLKQRISIAENAGIENIIIDPGIGFGKKVQDNFEIIKNISLFKKLNKPVLIGLSRKSFLGKTLGLETDQRDTATAISEYEALKQGAHIIRTHNVTFAKQAVDLLSLLT